MRTLRLPLGHDGMKVGGYIVDDKSVVALRAEFAASVLNGDHVKAGFVEFGVEVVCKADDLKNYNNTVLS